MFRRSFAAGATSRAANRGQQTRQAIVDGRGVWRNRPLSSASRSPSEARPRLIAGRQASKGSIPRPPPGVSGSPRMPSMGMGNERKFCARRNHGSHVTLSLSTVSTHETDWEG
jgi:hypothetical protein